MQLGPTNNALTVLSFGPSLASIFEELKDRPEPAGLNRGLLKFKGLIPESNVDDLPWYTPSPVMGHQGDSPASAPIRTTGSGGGSKYRAEVFTKECTYFTFPGLAKGLSHSFIAQTCEASVDVGDTKYRISNLSKGARVDLHFAKGSLHVHQYAISGADPLKSISVTRTPIKPLYFEPNDTFVAPPGETFTLTVWGSGGRQSSDGKEIITGDTVEGDDAPQVPDDKKEGNNWAAMGQAVADEIYKSIGIDPKALTNQQKDDLKTRETIKNYLAPYKIIHEKNREILNKIDKTLADCTLDTASRKSPYSLGAVVPYKQPHRTGKIVRQGYETGRFYEVVQMPDGREFMTYKD